MILKYLIITLILLRVILLGFSQEDPYMIPWSKDVRLKFEDFHEDPDSASKFDALSMIGPWIKPSANSAKRLEIRTYFAKYGSWMKPNVRIKELLEHENVHFDIAELFTRKIIMKYDSLLRLNIEDHVVINLINNRIVHSINFECADLNAQFDFETKHGQYYGLTVEWLEKIHKELKKYEEYSYENYYAR